MKGGADLLPCVAVLLGYIMGHPKAAAVQQQQQQKQHVYKKNPLLVKPGKRTKAEALPSALHMGVCVGCSLLVFAIINICVTELLGPKNPFVRLVQSGTMVSTLAHSAMCLACPQAHSTSDSSAAAARHMPPPPLY